MFSFSEQFVALQRQSLESTQAIASASFAGLEKLGQLNAQAAKSSLEASFQQCTSLLETKDGKAVAETLAKSAQPGDTFTAYAKHVHEIASETCADIAKVVEKQFSTGNRQLTASIEAMAKNSPMGSEGLTTLFRSAVTAANTTWDQVNKANRQVVDMTEANVASLTNAAQTASKRKAA